MGRLRRQFQPGGIFHLTARTIRREHRLTPRLRTVALHDLAEVTPRSGAQLLAVAIMANHLHIVARQGKRPLSALMQRLLRRLAGRVQKVHGLDGPIFWRPYACESCLDPWHARNAIVYTHLNPVRAHLCVDPSEYRWTSHALYTSGPSGALPPELWRLSEVLDPSVALPLFATGPEQTPEGLRGDYRAFVDRRLREDALARGDDTASDEVARMQRPPSAWWNAAWGAAVSPLFHAPVRSGRRAHDDRPAVYAPDMPALARATLAVEAPGMRLESIKGRGGGRAHSRIRHIIIRRLHAAGYRNIQIARFLDLSESAIWYALRPRDATR